MFPKIKNKIVSVPLRNTAIGVIGAYHVRHQINLLPKARFGMSYAKNLRNEL